MKISVKPSNQASVLIYGEASNSIINSLGIEKSVVVRPISRELNIGLIPRTLLKLVGRVNTRLFWSHFSLVFKGSYISAAAKRSGARLVITAIDEALEFYLAKEFCEDVRYVAIQNGLHDKEPMFSMLRSLAASSGSPKLDLVCAWSDPMAANFRAEVQARVVATGSLLNNRIDECLVSEVVSSVGLISSYEPFTNFEKEFIPLQEVMRSHMNNVLPRVAYLARQRGMRIVVMTRTRSEDERQFFRTILGGDVHFIGQDEEFRNLRNIDSVDAVFSCKSSLGFESVSRKNRTGIFWPSSTEAESSCSGFEWFGLPPSGHFWTESQSEVEIDRVFEFVVGKPASEWALAAGSVRDKFCIHDFGNTLVHQELEKLLT